MTTAEKYRQLEKQGKNRENIHNRRAKSYLDIAEPAKNRSNRQKKTNIELN